MTKNQEMREHHPAIYAPFERDDGQIVISDQTVESLATRIQTPFYAYCRKGIDARIAGLRAALPTEYKLHYAIKANPNLEVLRHVVPLVDGFDIASGGELARLEEIGYGMAEVSFAGPGKTAREIERAVSRDVVVIVESSTQLEMCNRIAGEMKRRARCMVRLNDHRQLGSGGLSMSGSSTVFGWDISDYVERGVPMFAELSHVDFFGFHLFYGSQILQHGALVQGIEISAQTICDVPVPSAPKFINLGGGLGIPYGPKDEPLDTNELTSTWKAAADRILGRFPETELCLELGRYIVGPAGLYVTKVVDRKTIGDNTFLVTDGGMHHFAAATGNFGQVLKRNHPIWPARPRLGDVEKVSVVGCLCTPMDVFARDVPLPPVEVGDLLVMFQAGAYGYTASPRDFLSHDAPAEVLF